MQCCGKTPHVIYTKVVLFRGRHELLSIFMSKNIEKRVPTELGTEKVGRLLMQYAIPAIIAQTAASLYNMIDSVFIGHIPDVGAEAI